jgi:hypothetical protein
MNYAFIELLRTKMADTPGIRDPMYVPNADFQKLAHASWELGIKRGFTGREASVKVDIPLSLSTDGRGDHSIQFYKQVAAASVFSAYRNCL